MYENRFFVANVEKCSTIGIHNRLVVRRACVNTTLFRIRQEEANGLFVLVEVEYCYGYVFHVAYSIVIDISVRVPVR
jgi:hypothetical protein